MELGELIERLEKATGPLTTPEIERCVRLSPWYDTDQHPAFWNDYCKALQGSIDAAVRLLEHVLPGWACGFDKGSRTVIAFADPHDFEDRMFGGRHIGKSALPSIAILTATLRAIQEKQQ